MAEQFLELSSPCEQQVEVFLRSVAGVLEATVWPRNDRILARVTVEEGSLLRGADLQQACLKNFGSELTPSMFLMEYRRGELRENAA